ncbi:glycosyltransferase [Thalassolituus oleivorans]|uniref:glycosyltransferase n=1 Tax=Thalassolituus oleivorans TaxID=187493 RepID=UPI0023F4E9CD|nr:glycosyltransferase [Thalassolituus oleivorans]
MRVVHVTESLGGGITSAVNAYASHSKQYKHYLFATIRSGDATGEESEGAFQDLRLVLRNVAALCKFVSYIKQIKPNVIHVHSTYAGFFVRLIPFVTACKIVYTPHAYAFLRNDHPLKLKAYYFIEKLLSVRTAVVAGCGLDECNIAKCLNPRTPTIELVNVCDDLPVLERNGSSDLPVVAMLGRVCEQKGFQFFADAAVKLKGRAKFLWIGGGDSQGVETLKRAGVDVTGWIPRPECLQYLVNSDLYFHSAQWDGFPISVLEAAHYQLPMVLRDIGPFTAEGLSVVSSANDAAVIITRFVEGDAETIHLVDENRNMVAEHHTSQLLAERLVELYSRFG